MYPSINKLNGYTEEHNGNKYLRLVHTDENKDELKKYEELWKKIKDLIRSINNNSDDYDKTYMKIKFSSDDDLPLKRTLKLRNIIIVVRSIFHEGKNTIHEFPWMNVCTN